MLTAYAPCLLALPRRRCKIPSSDQKRAARNNVVWLVYLKATYQRARIRDSHRTEYA